jgi:uncharacterized DUF497 family protein
MAVKEVEDLAAFGRVGFYTDITYSSRVRFEWDEDKNETKRKKHGVSFETAKPVFDDDHCLLILDRVQTGEERWHAIGMILNTALVLTVVHAPRVDGGQEIIRIISARRATPREENDYAESL